MTDKYSSPKIGDVLMAEGLIDEGQLQEALTNQKEDKELSELTVVGICIRKGLITIKDLEQILAHPHLRKRFGDMAVSKGLVEKGTLECLISENSSNMPIGELMVKAGLITEEECKKLLSEQVNSEEVAELAVKLGVVSQKDMKKVLRTKRSPRLLGEILSDMNLVNPLDLNNVLTKYGISIGIDEIMLKDGLISKELLDSSLKKGGQGSESIGDILLSKNLLTKNQYLNSMAKHLGIKYMRLDTFRYGEETKNVLSRLINEKYAEKNHVIPISKDKDKITIGLIKPQSMDIIQEMKTLFNDLEVSCVLISEDKFVHLFESLYNFKPAGISAETDHSVPEAGEVFEIDAGKNSEKDEGESSASYASNDLEVEDVVNFIITYGIKNGASDIHIEQDRKSVHLRYRIDGLLQVPDIPWLKVEVKEKVASIISRIKVISNLDISERRLPQDGVFRINYNDNAANKKFDIDFRVATCRAISGENVTIRILDSRNADKGLDNINISRDVLETLKKVLSTSSGMVLVTGPTGSGKSSTLYAALRYLYNPELKIITAEDPIEYSFPGIMQTQVLTKIGLTFPRLLRSFLRLDPDIILVGEMRDEETAKIGFDAAQTGHLLLSTLHTNNAIQSIRRLLDLDVNYGQIASSLKGVLAQRLVRRICEHCIEEYKPHEHEWGIISETYPSHLQFYKGKGCEACLHSGYKGRTAVSEILVINKEISYHLSKGEGEDRLSEIAVESGMKTMMEDGLSKLHQTTLSELFRVVPNDMIKMYRDGKRASNEPRVVSKAVG